MQPFAQDQSKSSGRAWAIVAVLATAFGVWFFDAVPRLKPVESGRLVRHSDAHEDIPALPESWDEIVDHTGETASISDRPDHDESNPLLAAITESNDSELPDLAEPDMFDVSTFDEPVIDDPASNESDFDEPDDPNPETAPDSDGQSEIQTASFTPSPDEINRTNSDAAVVPALSTRETRAVPDVDEQSANESVLPADTAAVIREADALLAEDKIVQAHARLSELYWRQPEQRFVILRRINTTASQIFTDPHRHFSRPHLVLPGDTLDSIAKQYDVPWVYLSQLNRVKPEDLQAGQELKVMRGPFHAVVDLSNFELTIHAHGYFVHRYEIGTGENASTPTGDFRVQEKLENPTWYNPDGGVVDADDPDNPLGEYWIGLGDHIGIHGTIDPDSIGRQRSRGCIHMRDNDIAEVFGLLGEKSTVRIRP